MSSSRDTILRTLSQNKPEQVPLPDLPAPAAEAVPLQERFSSVAIGIGSRVFAVKDEQEIKEKLEQLFPDAPHVVSEVEDLSFPIHEAATEAIPHSLATVDLAILRGKLAVAENSAIWVTGAQMGQRVLPFICQHLALVIAEDEIVSTMHDAYDLIGEEFYDYGVFIAGPSKTADIEQSLVLGAHGPRSLSVFIVKKEAGNKK